MIDDRTADPSLSRSEARTTIGSVASEVRAAATHTLDKAVTEVRAKADDAKADVATDVKDVATALRRASKELREGSAQERTLGHFATGLADASDSIRDKDLGEIVAMVSRIARENPVLFLGGAALLGLVASRYAKATGDHPDAPAAGKSAQQEAQEKAFVNEGNPNTQPGRAGP
jgi:hypothetical protein